MIESLHEIWEAFVDPDYPYLRRSVIAGILGSFSFGIVGTYVVTRRITAIAGAIAHSVLGGIGAALYLQSKGVEWVTPMHGIIIAAVLSALVIGLVSLFAKEREDSIITIIWVLGMSTGALFINASGKTTDAMSYLFGNKLHPC